MTYAITIWLCFVLAVGALIYAKPNFYQAAVFLLAAFLLLPASMLTLGRAATWSPANAEYTVLGAPIDVDVAIYVLLDDPTGEPRYYRLPYSVGSANKLQAALDGAADGEGGVSMGFGIDGEPDFSETHSESGPPKQAETPLLTVPAG